MQALLQKDVKKLGYRGDIVKVKDGFFRNYLQPRKLAEVANSASKKLVESRKAKILMEKQRLIDNAKEVLQKLHGLVLVFKKKASAKGKLFGAITENDIIKSVVANANVKLEKEYVKMEHLKAVGTYDVKIHLGEGLEETVKVEVQAAK